MLLSSSNINYESLFGASAGLLFVLMILFYFLMIGVAIAIYVLTAIALSKMAKKVGHPQPWMAWIPGPNYYLMCTMPDVEYKPLILKKTFPDRKAAFFAWLILMGVSFIAGFIMAIPYIGWFLSIFIMPVLTFVNVCIAYPVVKDLYDIFFDSKKAMIFAIVSLVVPIAMPVFFILASKEEPNTVKATY